MADEPQGSYKRNYFTPRNILIYVTIAIVLYGAVYFLFLRNNSSSPYQAPSTQTTEETSPTSENSMTVVLSAQNDSGENGSATLTEADGRTTVTIALDSYPADTPQPAHIHSGACPKPGEVVYPLTSVVNGASETVLDVDLATLQSALPLAVNVHKSAAQSSVYVSCGDLQ